MAQVIKFPAQSKTIITAPIPELLIKQREGGKKNGKPLILSYITGSTVIDLLNRSFDYLWNWDIVEQWVQESQPRYYPKYGENPVLQGPVAHVKGILTIYLTQENGTCIEIRKSGFGSKPILGGQNEQEHIFKAAATDALKKAASLVGIGLQLYRAEEEQAYFDEINYEDPWTEEALEKFSPEREYIQSAMQNYNATAEDIGEIINEWSQGVCQSIYHLTPENISGFVEYLKATLQADTEVSA